jgi:hypothetical protein
MANEPAIPKEKSKIAPFKDKEYPLEDTLRPEKPATSLKGPGSLVEPKGRSVNVSADAPKEETQSSPAGNINTPDKSGNYSIKDVPPQDR